MPLPSGEYMLCDSSMNFVVLGSRFDATLEDTSDYIDERESGAE